ncbi:MAG: hypothetical protein IPH12_09535 [Saprospirales bacterium]|nr:hypothetical protein [Saprospirales bacterium]
MCDYFDEVNTAKGKIMSECWPSAPKMQTGQKQIFLDAMVYTIVIPNPKADAEEPTLIFLTTPNAQKAAHLYAKRWK